MRSFMDAYEALGAEYGLSACRELTTDPYAEAYKMLMAKKEAALAGFIVYYALGVGDGPTREYLRAVFGEWAWRAEIVREDHGYFLRG